MLMGSHGTSPQDLGTALQKSWADIKKTAEGGTTLPASAGSEKESSIKGKTKGEDKDKDKGKDKKAKKAKPDAKPKRLSKGCKKKNRFRVRGRQLIE